MADSTGKTLRTQGYLTHGCGPIKIHNIKARVSTKTACHIQEAQINKISLRQRKLSLIYHPLYWKYKSKNNLVSKGKRTCYQENRKLMTNKLCIYEVQKTYKYHKCMIAAWAIIEVFAVRVPATSHFSSEAQLTFKRRIKSHLPFAGIIRGSPYSPSFRHKG